MKDLDHPERMRRTLSARRPPHLAQQPPAAPALPGINAASPGREGVIEFYRDRGYAVGVLLSKPNSRSACRVSVKLRIWAISPSRQVKTQQ
jgi:hypothetical protein